MKKKLLLVVLALAILTSLTAGTLAVYTRTLTDVEQIEAKRFAFSIAGKIANDNKAINLAPTESMNYLFSIANVEEENGPVAEVPLQYVVTIDFSAAAEAMSGLTATLYSGTTVLAESSNGVISYTTNSAADALFDEDYVVTLTWADNGQNSSHTSAGTSKVTIAKGLNLTVVATQITE